MTCFNGTKRLNGFPITPRRKAVFWLRLEMRFMMIIQDLRDFLIPGTCD
jgi:hypothetical protein